MPSLARAEIESLLRARRLDRTLTSVLPGNPGRDEAALLAGSTAAEQEALVRIVVPTGIAVLDAQLGGGFPRGHLSEIAGPLSSGRTSVLCASLAAATRRGELVALVDTLDTFDPDIAAAAGMELTRFLWVRGAVGTGEAQGRAVDRALKAVNLLLQGGEFGIVALDLADVATRTLQGLPFTTWMRLQRVIEGGRTACVLLGAAPIARSSAGLTLTLRPADRSTDRGCWSGGSDYARLFRGLEIQARVIRARLRPRDDSEICLRASALENVRTGAFTA